MTTKDVKKKDISIPEDTEEIINEIPTLSKKKRKYKVISYNPKSNTLVFERNSIRYQSNCIDYDGVSKEIELEME